MQLEHSALTLPGALSIHVAWSTQRSRGRVGSSSAPVGLRAPGPQSPHGLRREWRWGVLSHQSVCPLQRWTDHGHLNRRVRTKGQR